MFDNIGEKIMILAKVTAFVGIAACLIGAIVLWTQASELSSYYESGAKTTFNIAGWGLFIGGSFGSWVGSFAMYAFGQLVDDTADIKRHLLAHPLTDRSTSGKTNASEPRPSDYSDLPKL